MVASMFLVIFSALTHKYMELKMVNKMVKSCGYFKTISGGEGSRGFPLQGFECLPNKNLIVSALSALIHI